MTLAHDLAQFTGTDKYYKHPLFARHVLWTDGVNHFINNSGGGAYWFLDIILTEIAPLHREHPFLSVTLSVTPESRAVIKVTDGNETDLWSRDISFTDTPTGDYRFFMVDNVFLLTSEY